MDLWAAGCIFAELLTLQPLFQGEDAKDGHNPFQADQLNKCEESQICLRRAVRHGDLALC